MLIDELAKRTGVSIQPLQYYENYGLFDGKADEAISTNNYKQYDKEIVEKIAWIKEAKLIGFTLSEIKALLKDWFSDRLPVEKKVAVLTAKINEIDRRIDQLKEVRKLLLAGIEDVKNGKC